MKRPPVVTTNNVNVHNGDESPHWSGSALAFFRDNRDGISREQRRTMFEFWRAHEGRGRIFIGGGAAPEFAVYVRPFFAGECFHCGVEFDQVTTCCCDEQTTEAGEHINGLCRDCCGPHPQTFDTSGSFERMDCGRVSA